MKKSTTIVLASLVSAALLCACGPGGPARPQLTEITDGDGARAMMTYVADKLTSVKSVDKNGSVTQEVVVTYEGNELKTVSAAAPGEAPMLYTYTYNTDRLLSQVTGIGGNSTYSATYTYSNGLVSRSVVTATAGELGTTSTTDYTYNSLRQPSTGINTAVSTWGPVSVTAMWTSTYTYDSATALLKEIQVASESGTTLTQFTYDTSSRLERVTAGTSIYTLEYGTDGNVSRSLHQSGNSTTFKSYKYQPGTLTGIIANPLINYGGMFDMVGKELPHDQVYVTGSLMGLQE